MSSFEKRFLLKWGVLKHEVRKKISTKIGVLKHEVRKKIFTKMGLKHEVRKKIQTIFRKQNLYQIGKICNDGEKDSDNF